MNHSRAAWCAAALLGLTLTALPLWAADGPATIALITRTLEARYPGAHIDSVRPAPVAGLYEVFTGDRIVYTDPKADYLLVGGSLVDTRTGTDLTAARVDALSAVDFAKLPFDRAIKVVKGNGRRRLAVFADPDCPYCQELEHALVSVNDVTIYTFLYPLAEVHPQATAKAHSIWCAPDRAQAWSEWMLKHKMPAAATCRGDPVVQLQALGSTLHINSTPTMFLENGQRISGAVSAGDLEKLLASAASGAKPGS